MEKQPVSAPKQDQSSATIHGTQRFNGSNLFGQFLKTWENQWMGSDGKHVEKRLRFVILIFASAALQRPGSKEAQENHGDSTSKLHDHNCDGQAARYQK